MPQNERPRTDEEKARAIFGAVLHHTVEEELWRIAQALSDARAEERENCARIAETNKNGELNLQRYHDQSVEEWSKIVGETIAFNIREQRKV